MANRFTRSTIATAALAADHLVQRDEEVMQAPVTSHAHAARARSGIVE